MTEKSKEDLAKALESLAGGGSEAQQPRKETPRPEPLPRRPEPAPRNIARPSEPLPDMPQPPGAQQTLSAGDSQTPAKAGPILKGIPVGPAPDAADGISSARIVGRKDDPVPDGSEATKIQKEKEPAADVKKPEPGAPETAVNELGSLELRRTLIPLLLTMGVLMPAIGISTLVLGDESPLGEQKLMAIMMILLGAAAAVVAVATMLPVKRLLSSR